MDLVDACWLTTTEAQSWLRAHADTPPKDWLALATRARGNWAASRAGLLLEQLRLRQKATEKLGAFAPQALLTARGLEQATDWRVARYKADRFPPGALAVDLCSGLGCDLLALARRGPVLGVDRDAAIARLAAWNLSLQLEEARRQDCLVVAAEASLPQLAGARAWHIDPDRRPHGGRSTRTELHDPPLAVLEQLLRASPHGAIKLAPAAQVPAPWQMQAECEWISRAGQCRQLVVWFGELAQHAGARRATLIDAAGTAHHVQGPRPSETRTEDAIRRFLAEPEPGVLASGLSDVLAERHQLGAIDSHCAYLTGDTVTCDAQLAWFEVLEVLPFDQRRVKTILVSRGVGQVEVKVRGLPVSPAALQRAWRGPGPTPLVVLLARVRNQGLAIVARRVHS